MRAAQQRTNVRIEIALGGCELGHKPFMYGIVVVNVFGLAAHLPQTSTINSRRAPPLYMIITRSTRNMLQDCGFLRESGTVVAEERGVSP